MTQWMFRISGDALEEIADRLPPEELAAYRRWVLRVPELDPLVRQIEQAFDGERLGNGIGLLEAQGIDDYAGEAELAELRSRDERTDWRRIDVDLLNRCYTSPCFFDARGYVFHLPAYLIAALNDNDDYGFIDNLILSLASSPDWLLLLSVAQREAIAATLRLVGEHPEYMDRTEVIHTAIKRLTTQTED